MFEQRTTRRPPAVGRPKTLAASSAAIPHGTEIVVKSVQLPDEGFPVIESLYMDGDANTGNDLQFRCTLDGVQIGADWALPNKQPTGQKGNPRSIGDNLSPGRLFEIRCNNTGTDDTLRAYTDGEIQIYARPL